MESRPILSLSLQTGRPMVRHQNFQNQYQYQNQNQWKLKLHRRMNVSSNRCVEHVGGAGGQRSGASVTDKWDRESLI
jgi:hypothetical protein